MDTLLAFCFFIALILLITGSIKPAILKFQSRKMVFLIFGGISIATLVVGAAISLPIPESPTPKSITSQSSTSPSLISSATSSIPTTPSISPKPVIPSTPPSSQLKTSQSEMQNVKTFNDVSTSIASYKMPVRSGKWRTCVAERINTLSNLQLISFYEWIKSLSPYASEETQLTSIARKLGCPEPIVRVIPAVTELIKSFSGVGSQNLGVFSFENDQWGLSGSWNGGESKVVSIDSEEHMIAALSDGQGIFLCDVSGEACSVLGFGFDKPSGNFDFSVALIEKGTFVIKVGAPNSASWNISLFKILEPSKIIVE